MSLPKRHNAHSFICLLTVLALLMNIFRATTFAENETALITHFTMSLANKPVTRAMTIFFYGALKGHFTAFRSLETVQYDEPMTTTLTRADLYSLLARALAEPLEELPKEYYLGTEGDDLPLDMFAQLGVVNVPANRFFVNEETVSWFEAQQHVVRAVLPEFRIQNDPAIVSPQQMYSYEQLEMDINRLLTLYPQLLTVEVIGQSVEGRSLYAMRIGQGEHEILIDAAIHASEWLTTPLTMKMVEEYAHHAHHGTLFGQHDVAVLLQEVSFWFIPMINPDGVTLVQSGPDAIIHGALAQQILSDSEDFTTFKGWKANSRGVDLNRQFPISWTTLTSVRDEPAPSHFKGHAPLSEPEAQALYDFARFRRPVLTLSFHQQGEWLFWYHKQTGAQLERDEKIVQALAAVTGYRYQYYNDNGGKYMDFVITELGVPGITVEVGTVVGDLRQWQRIWQQTRTLPLVAAELVLPHF
ncbi:MAG: M14 family zinc carboxypeptidase [Firmicutes bacterium]|nr:M14 family zinc carboxypeptidase [Bacillota bacterium]